jgi:benzoyl-CoA reductase/2-hydroxyglutaryl-CoA dehydratase subunit BcrC/BadD/HgdB
LVQAIINTNDEERVRSGLIQELNTKFPDFLENIEDENVTNDLLRTTLEKVNDEYRKKIILQLSEEKVTEIIKGQNAAILKRIELEKN